MRNDKGSAAIELAIMTPAVIALFVTVVFAGRLTVARQAADSAAFDAARVASIAKNRAAGVTAAKTAALNSFKAQGITCTTLTATVTTTPANPAPGQPGTVRVEVTCVAQMKDIAAFPWVPGSVTLKANFISPLDRYRSRA